MSIKNLVLHISLPKGLRLTNGATLMMDTTLDVVSTLDPFYAGVDQVKLNGGYFLRTTSDLTIACSIYNSSQEADYMTPNQVDPLGTSPADIRLANCRNQWVTAKATRDLLLNNIGLIGSPGAHVLANFSVTRARGGEYESVAAKLKDLDGDVKLYAVCLASNGQTLPGGHARPGFGAKGVADWTERTPSRSWATTGIGANTRGLDFGSANGGRGKPSNFASRITTSPPIVNWRMGVYQGFYPLTTVFGEAGSSSGNGLRATGGGIW